MPYAFLSDEWIEAARTIRQEAPGPPGVPQPLRMNLVITAVPFGEGSVAAHMDTTSGRLQVELGHVDAADVTATLDYDTARAVMVDASPQAIMQAFMAGRIMLQGDMAKAMAVQSEPVDPELARRIREITA